MAKKLHVVAVDGYPDARKRYFIYLDKRCLRVGVFFSRDAAERELKSVKKEFIAVLRSMIKKDLRTLKGLEAS